MSVSLAVFPYAQNFIETLEMSKKKHNFANTPFLSSHIYVNKQKPTLAISHPKTQTIF